MRSDGFPPMRSPPTRKIKRSKLKARPCNKPSRIRRSRSSRSSRANWNFGCSPAADWSCSGWSSVLFSNHDRNGGADGDRKLLATREALHRLYGARRGQFFSAKLINMGRDDDVYQTYMSGGATTS